MRIGYVRVYAGEQTLALQLGALADAGCVSPVYRDTRIDTARPRAALDMCTAHLQGGDTLVIWKLDRLARSTSRLLAILLRLAERDIAVESIVERITPSTAPDRVRVLAALATFERTMIRRRAATGVAAARARGARIGRPPALSAEQIAVAREMASEGRTTCEIAQFCGVTPRTIRAVIARQGYYAQR